MHNGDFDSKRRDFLKGGAGLALGLTPGLSISAAAPLPITRRIPSSKELLPVIGMGTWITFNAGDDPRDREQRVRVLQAFFDNGGALIDSSPMYGRSEEVLGHCLPRVQGKQQLFAATKVWIYGKALGMRQMERSRELWGVRSFDLMQVHNLLDWEDHLDPIGEFLN